MAESRLKLQEVHNFLIKHSGEVFSEQTIQKNYYDLMTSASSMSTEAILDILNDPEFEDSLKNNTYLDILPISEYIYFLAQNNQLDLEGIDEYKLIINNEKPIWHFSSKKIAQLLKIMKISYDEIKRRIKDEFILGESLGMVMARAEKGSESEDLYNASIDFSIKKEEHKRDMFLDELKKYF